MPLDPLNWGLCPQTFIKGQEGEVRRAKRKDG